MTDDDWMRRALDLAERGRGAVEPNPLVGAVLVRDGRVVGEGWHQRFGGPHAEVNALAAAGDAARGATLYVTLEPCCHHGKTPPCTDAVLHAGVARVVLDSHGRLPDACVLARTARATPTVVAATPDLPATRKAGLEAQGCEVLCLPAHEGRTDVGALLDELGRRRFTNVLVEGGAAVLGSFLDAGAVHEVHAFIAPRLAGGAAALTPVGGQGVARIAEALALAECRV